ncbi:MAG: 2-amino-4-hydroxy-6-hydroxymethyldihydropteridine diphosphokinase [Leptolyngbyaceae cyanobacterium CSU_1_3]|nr:2-amino-4-hydroxy-6-hydroxymethyldihydropteridine diphosphokinase [Leptolyngbyaceae cyanobacterium CSU_1_3]
MEPASCAIALGSNLGNSRKILESALEQLDRLPGISLIQRSHWYQNKAVTLTDTPQPDYLNGCALLKTTLTPSQLLHTLLDIETQFGRVRQERWGARTLDLDLLLFNDVILSTDDLQIPHPRLSDRPFVLMPLVEIAPDWLEPLSGKTIAQLAQTIDPSDLKKLDP